MKWTEISKISKWIFSKTLAQKFMTLAIVVTVITLGFMIVMNHSMQSRQASIIKNYTDNKEAIDVLLQQERRVIMDSVFPSEQKIAIFDRLQQRVDEVQKKSDVNSIESMLNLEFSKIQGEYEVLNLWCALLTVVFLVFSIYSVFRSNELHNQAERALRSLKRTETEAKEKSGTIDKAAGDAEKKVRQELKTHSDAAKKLLNGVETKVGELTEKLEATEKKTADLEVKLLAAKDGFSNSDKKFTELMQQAVDKANSCFAEEIVKAKQASATDLDLRVRELKLEIDSLRAELEEFHILGASESLSAYGHEKGNPISSKGTTDGEDAEEEEEEEELTAPTFRETDETPEEEHE